jgi:hypothetical protein
MRIRRRPMQARDVQACADLTSAHPLERQRYGELLAQLSAAWRVFLRAGSLVTGVMEDADCENPSVLGFGMSAFVTDEFLHHCKFPMLRWIGPELLRWHLSGRSPILNIKQIGEANAKDGLNTVAWAAALAPRDELERAPLQLEIMSGFMQEHLGFKLKEIVSQPIEASMIEVVLNSGGFLWNSDLGCYSEARCADALELMQKPFALGADHQTATRHLNWTSTVFHYRQPCIFFRPAEQRLLLAALRGLKDEELSDALGVSLSFVKKTWSSIYERSVAKAPELRLDLSDGSFHQRGKEKKQRVLSYVREHPEELRPFRRNRQTQNQPAP